MKVRRQLIRFELAIAFVMLAVSISWAASYASYEASTAAELKDAMERSDVDSKTISTNAHLTLDTNVKAFGNIAIDIGDHDEALASPSGSLTIGRNTTITTVGNFMDSLLFANGSTEQEGASGTYESYSKECTLNIRGAIVINDGHDFSVTSDKWTMNASNKKEYGSGGGLTVRNNGCILIKTGGGIHIQTNQSTTFGKTFTPEWDGRSDGTIVFEEGAYLFSVPAGLFIDSGKVFVGHNSPPNPTVKSANTSPSEQYLTAGTYRYDSSRKAYVKESNSTQIALGTDTSDEAEEQNGPDLPANTIPTSDIKTDNPNVYADAPASVSTIAPSDLPTGYTHKGTISMSLFDTGHENDSVVLTITMPPSLNITTGMNDLVVLMKPQNSSTYTEIPVTVIQANTIRFTVSPVGRYFSNAHIVVAARSSQNTPGNDRNGTTGGGGGCSTGAGLIALAALGLAMHKRKVI